LSQLGLCNEDDGLAIARLLCTKGVTEAGLPTCKTDWCKSSRPLDWAKCILDIGRFGWARVWCAANIIFGGNPALCTLGDCRKCNSDIVDFGWPIAMGTWSGYLAKTGITDDGDCLNAGDLPSGLATCQQGIVIQVETTPNVWTTIKAIPSESKLCSNTLVFSSSDPTVSMLFTSPIRVMQCSLDADCLQDSCLPQVGFAAQFTFNAADNVAQDIVAMVQDNDLICDPIKWPNSPYGCMSVVPPTMCPCSATKNSKINLLI